MAAMSAGVLLIPNLNAERGAGWGAPAFAPTGEAARAAESARERVQRTAAALWRNLFAPGARCAGEARAGVEPPWPRALGVRNPCAAFAQLEVRDCAVAWLNTPAARQIAASERLELLGAPPEVVREVHDRAFAQRVAVSERLLPAALEPCVAVLEPESLRDCARAVREIEASIARWPAPWTSGFVLEPRFGARACGRVAAEARRVADAAGAFARLADSGGALLRPRLARRAEISAELWIGGDGQLVLLGTLERLDSASGSFRGRRGCVDASGRVTSGSPHDGALRDIAAVVARAAAAAGYAGPCGVDACAFEGADGEAQLWPVVELKARFTLGTLALGWLRRALPRIRAEAPLADAALRAFEFRLEAPPGGWPSGAGERALCIELGGPEPAGTARAEPGRAARAEPGLLVAADRAALDRCLALGRAIDAPPSERLH
ncbi:MAG TPA: hypothetical protein VEC18_06180 [Myxococcota bacterium]|nr:hypothetical protein [Myxococcota bacterium]